MNRFLKYAILLLLIGLLIIIPERLIFSDDHSLCIFRNLTGIKCPLCGMTRACYLMFNLEFKSALAFNPLVFLLPLLLLLEILNDINKTPFISRIRKISWIAIVVGLLALFILRLFEFFSNN
ncbi:MAG: DUF2752 domain-containing protein [Bacteroidales bacterium]|nr:DUF2752 domain-containing protein [Bacteroidales bacterium]